MTCVCVLESSISSICVRPISLLNLTLFACWIHPVPWSVLGEMTSTSSDSSGSKWSVVGGTGKREALPKEKAWAVLSHGYWGPMAPVRQLIAKRCLTDIHGNIIHYNTIIWKNNTLSIHQPKYPKTSIAVYPTTLITLIALKREEKHMQKNNTLTRLLLELACLVAIESCCR